MKILLIDANCRCGSTGKIAYDLYTNYREKGHKSAVCYGRGELIKEPGIYKFGLDWETCLHAALARVTGYNGCFSYFSTKRLLRYIEHFQPDIIHIHELHAYFVNIVPLINYIKKKKIKLVWTFHCEYMYTGKCGYSYECERWKTECGSCPYLREYPKAFFADKTKQMLKRKKELLSDLDFTIVVPSVWLAERVRQSFLRNKEIKVIQNGIDTTIFKPVDTSELRHELGIPDKNKIILSVAPDIMSERKGGKWVLRLAKMMEDKKITFVLVGGKSKKKGIRKI